MVETKAKSIRHLSFANNIIQLEALLTYIYTFEQKTRSSFKLSCIEQANIDVSIGSQKHSKKIISIPKSKEASISKLSHQIVKPIANHLLFYQKKKKLLITYSKHRIQTHHPVQMIMMRLLMTFASRINHHFGYLKSHK